MRPIAVPISVCVRPVASLFALVEEEGERVDGRVVVGGMAFEDHAEVRRKQVTDVMAPHRCRHGDDVVAADHTLVVEPLHTHRGWLKSRGLRSGRAGPRSAGVAPEVTFELLHDPVRTLYLTQTTQRFDEIITGTVAARQLRKLVAVHRVIRSFERLLYFCHLETHAQQLPPPVGANHQTAFAHDRGG